MGTPANNPPLVALVANVQTPYRIHLHRRIAREIPQIRIASLFTHDQPDQPWEQQAAPEINPVPFGRGHPVSEQSKPRWALADWHKGGRIIRWLKDRHAAAVILGGYNDLTRIRLISWCRRHDVPCFLVGDSNIKGDNASGFRRTVKNRFARWAVRSCSGVMPCGTLGAAYFARYGADPDRTYFVPYEPDYSVFRDVAPDAVTAALARTGLDPSRRRIVVCARLIPVKRVDLAIDAFAAIAAERPDWDLVIIGDGPLRTELGSRVPASLKSRVIWTGFINDAASIAAVYKGSHLLLCPSDFEPWAVVLNEAAAAGMAIIASDVVGAAAELVRDGVNGRVFPKGDPAALTSALRDTTDPATIERSRAGSARVLADWQRRGDPIQGLRSALRHVSVIP